MTLEGLFGTALEVGMAGMVLNTTKDILTPEEKKKKKKRSSLEHDDSPQYESFW